jgi:transposase
LRRCFGRFRYPGRKRLDDRKVLSGILIVVQTGIPWEYLPQQMGCGSGMTRWRRLREWQEAGVWQRLHELLLAKLNEADRIDWSRAAIDSSHVRAFGGRNDRPEPGRPLQKRLQAPPDRLRPRHAAGRLAHRRQPQRQRRDDPAWSTRSSREGRRQLRCRCIQTRIAWPKSAHGSGLGKKRWVVERTIAWLQQYRRLRIRLIWRTTSRRPMISLPSWSLFECEAHFRAPIWRPGRRIATGDDA